MCERSFRCLAFRNVSLSLASGLLLCGMSVSVSKGGDDEISPTGESDSAVERVLLAEQSGDLEARSDALEQLTPQSEPESLSNSLLGNIRQSANEWISVDDSVQDNLSSDALDKYEAFRATQPNSIDGHLAVANWCKRNRMYDQFRAHLQSVLFLEPNHEGARLALQHRLIGERWYSAEELTELERRSRWTSDSLKKFGPEVQRILATLKSGGERQYLLGKKRLERLTSDDAIPAVILNFAGTTGPISLAAVEWLGERSHIEATVALAEWAISSPDASVRAACIAQLQERSLFEFAPYLLNNARAKLESTIIPTYRPDGTLAGVRYAVAEEGRENVNLHVHDSVNIRTTVSGLDNPTPSIWRGPWTRGRRLEEQVQREIRLKEAETLNALKDMQARVDETQKAMAFQNQINSRNEQTETRNNRIAIVFAETSGTSPSASIKDLWSWWSSYTEREQPPIKFTSMKYDIRFKNYGAYATTGTGDVVDGDPPRHECFAAGTSVQTSRGAKPIEAILPGDAVLSKALDSGELFWDMVVATTNQPPKQTVEVKTDGETFQCTGGHLFWVSGKGWTKARELLPGDVLHGASAPAKVVSCNSSESQPTFNLVTEKAHNYFVGEGKLLTHDFEEPEPTAVRVPGLPNLL